MGILRVPALNVAAPLVPVVVSVNGALHVPLPFQKVVALAPVPLFRLVTGRLPVTSLVERSTLDHVPLPCQKVFAPAPVPPFKLPTGRLPLTSAPSATALHVPLPCQSVFAVAPVPPFRLPTGKLPVTSAPRLTAEYVGAAADPVELPRKVCAAALDNVNDCVGVVVDVVTDVVNMGERFPLLKEVTVPLPTATQALPL